MVANVVEVGCLSCPHELIKHLSHHGEWYISKAVLAAPKLAVGGCSWAEGIWLSIFSLVYSLKPSEIFFNNYNKTQVSLKL